MIKTIEKCTECPFTIHIYEQGFCGNCCKFITYGTIPNKGILKDCPLKKEDIIIRLVERKEE